MKAFFTTLFIKQNQYHKYSVFGHTIAVTKECFKLKRYNLIPAAILHDIGKPVVAFQDEDDIPLNTYSFTGHEEKSYQMIKKIPFISERTKIIVRYHYLITGMASDLRKLEKKKDEKYRESFNKRKNIWDSLDEKTKNDLFAFKICDDKGKGYPNQEVAVPDFLKNDLNKFNQ